MTALPGFRIVFFIKGLSSYLSIMFPGSYWQTELEMSNHIFTLQQVFFPILDISQNFDHFLTHLNILILKKMTHYWFSLSSWSMTYEREQIESYLIQISNQALVGLPHLYFSVVQVQCSMSLLVDNTQYTYLCRYRSENSYHCLF